MSDEALYREATLAELFSGQKASPVYSVKYVVPVEPAGVLTVTVVTDHGVDKWIDWGSHIPKLGRFAIVRLDDETFDGSGLARPDYHTGHAPHHNHLDDNNPYPYKAER